MGRISFYDIRSQKYIEVDAETSEEKSRHPTYLSTGNGYLVSMKKSLLQIFFFFQNLLSLSLRNMILTI